MAETLNDKINKRPLCACCAAFSAGLVAVSFLGGATVPGIIFSAAAFLVALYAWFIQKYGFELKLRKKLNDDKQLAAAVAAGMLAIGSMIPHIIAGGIQNRLETWSGEHAVTCRVTEITSRYPYFSSATVSVTEIDGEKVSFSARLTVEQELETGTGGVLRLENAALSPIPEDENGFPAARYYAGRGIYYEIECESLVTGETEPTLYDRVSSFSARLSARLAVLCGRDEGGLASALFLGKKDALPDSVKRDFSRLGISHLLAVSGLHLTMIVFFAEKISAAVFRKRFTPLFVSIGVAAFYAVLTGLHYSVIRAAIMLTAALTAKYAGRRADPPTSLAVAAAL
ncbi:MAG: ComEC/Rec2 family competence protein, partial [Clostridia bacterium]|nr:ComEC/Rec2 family competence protein [Clostridia bacterium]